MNAQSTRGIRFSCPLGDDKLVIRRLHGTENLSECYQFDIDLLSTDSDLDINSLLGERASVCIATNDDGRTRYLAGVVTEMSVAGYEGRNCLYHVVLRPWLWLLTRAMDCRIFQNKTALDIIKEVFRAQGFSDFEERLSKTFAKRDYCVQYRETDFAFVSRLLEEEGVYYYFRHEHDNHVLVLADSRAAHDPAPGAEAVAYAIETSGRECFVGHFTDWRMSRTIQPGQVTLRDYNFLMPRANLTTSSKVPNQHAHASFEVFDYPGCYAQYNDGSAIARTRMEELNAQHEVAQGTCDARALPCGALFRLMEHPRQDLNKEYLVTGIRYDAEVAAYESGRKDQPIAYRAFVTALDTRIVYRPKRQTPKPVVPGAQTAVVVGSGSDMWVDEHGRVKVQFHWDRDGNHDENSSCWVRVSQVWASAAFGSMQIPHLGDEVVVTFLEGNPDLPLIIGRVYHAANRSWCKLPGDQSKSYFRDMGGNHICLDESMGAEKLELFSPQKETKVALGATESPGICMHTDGNMTETIKENHTNKVDGTFDHTVGGDVTQTYTKDMTRRVGGNVTEDTIGSKDESVHGDLKAFVLGTKEEVVSGPFKLKRAELAFVTTVGLTDENYIGGKTETFGGLKFSLSLAAAHETKVGLSTEIHKAYKVERGVKSILQEKVVEQDVTNTYHLKAKKVLVESSSTIEFKMGSTRLSLLPNGNFVVQSDKPVKIEGQKVEMKANEFKAKVPKTTFHGCIRNGNIYVSGD